MYKLENYSFIWLAEHPIVSYDNGKEVKLYQDCDGYVSYFITSNKDAPEKTFYLRQLFSKSPVHQSNANNVWQWDGDRENPTLNPSFLWPDGRMHLFVVKGSLNILLDTTMDYSSYKRINDNVYTDNE